MRTSRRVRRDILLIKEDSVLRFFCQELHQVTHKLGRRLVGLTKEHGILTTYSLTLKYKFYMQKPSITIHFIQMKYAILSAYFI